MNGLNTGIFSIDMGLEQSTPFQLVSCGFDDGSIIDITYKTLTDLDCQIIAIEEKYNINFIECL